MNKNSTATLKHKDVLRSDSQGKLIGFSPFQEVKHQLTQQQPSIKQQGLTLIEMAIVVSIVAVTALVALPDLSSSNQYKLDSAAAELVEAIRFARAEALRTGIPHGINTSSSSDMVRVYSLPSSTPTYNVYHPIDKKLYVIQFNSQTNYSGIELDNATFSFASLFNSSLYLGFNSHGMPKYTGGIPTRDYMLTSGNITISYNNEQRIISIAPMTGRVTIQ